MIYAHALVYSMKCTGGLQHWEDNSAHTRLKNHSLIYSESTTYKSTSFPVIGFQSKRGMESFIGKLLGSVQTETRGAVAGFYEATEKGEDPVNIVIAKQDPWERVRRLVDLE